jgi:protein SCO1
MISRAVNFRKTFFLAAGAALGFMAVIGIGWWQVDGPGADHSANLPASVLPSIGDMSFSMIDHEGDSVGPEKLLDYPSMVFFGYTFCPDVCPTTLADISGWLDGLGPDNERLKVIFISVDSGRDTPEVMADYVTAFHPKIRGWTGTPGDVSLAASAFRVTYKKVPLDDGGYTMDHSASVFLFDKTGKFRSTIDFHESREIAVPKIRRMLREH